ncbi:MAG: class IV adenylate cyclase [Halanaeroarchaeum sp.]
MYEVEVKVRTDHEAVREALAARGATRIGAVEQTDVYYDAPHRDFAETDEALRIRREDDGETSEAALTYKGPLLEEASKTREEIETALVEPDAVDEILDALGFAPAATVQKSRERWRLEGFVVSLDAVEDLGQFVEVETAVETEDEVASARDGARDLLRSLDLSPGSQIRTSYLGLLLASS